MPKRILPDLAIVLTFLREGQGVSQTDMAKAAGTTSKLISDYEAGRKNLSRGRLEYLIGFLDLPAERIDVTLACLHETRAVSQPPRNPGDAPVRTRRRIEKVTSMAARQTEDFVRSLLQLLTVEGEALHARQRAEFLWNRLKKHSPKQRRTIVEELRQFQNWALSERVAAESIDLAPNHPQESLETARLSLQIAEKVPGGALWRRRVEGYALAHVSNGLRVCNDLPAMATAIHRARTLWEEGEAGDPGLLNPAVVPWIEAAVRRAQRQFPEAMKRIDEALTLDSGELRGKILMTKSGILKALGDSEGSTKALSEAEPLIDGRKEPQLALYLKFNLLSDLCRIGQPEKVEPHLEEVGYLAEKLGERLDLARIVWLRGLTAAGLGRNTEAEAAFGQVRREFESYKLAYDYALVSLDLTLVLLKQGRHGEVRKIAQEMVGIFKTLKVGQEALMALQVFCDATKKETATIEMTRELVQFLVRSQCDPDLQFKE